MILRKKLKRVFYSLIIIGAVVLNASVIYPAETDASSHIRGSTDTAGDVVNTDSTNNNTNSNQTTATPSGDYQLLVELPNITTVSKDSGFADYAQAIITLIMGFSALLAVLMFMIGGFTYMTGDSIGSKSEGRGIMTNAIFGFVLLLASWLILMTINPQLLNLDLNIKQVEQAAAPAGDGSVTPPENINTLQVLERFGSQISINSTGGCTDRNNRACTSLDGIREQTIGGIINLKDGCNRGNSSCNITISGGTEVGHESGQYSHANGYKVDISKNAGDAQKFQQFLNNQTVVDQEQPLENMTARSMVLNHNYNFNYGGYYYVIRPEEDHWDITVVNGPR